MQLSPWIMAGRPRTLTLSVTPVIVGAALAWAVERELHWGAIVAALVASMFIQLGTNLHNDAADSERGGDGPDRVGPPRVTASGLLEASAIKRGAMICFALAALMGLYLVAVGGWPILLLGIFSILSGWAYTGGPMPIAYTSAWRIVRCDLLWTRRGVWRLLALHWMHSTCGNRNWPGARPARGRGAPRKQPSRCRS